MASSSTSTKQEVLTTAPVSSMLSGHSLGPLPETTTTAGPPPPTSKSGEGMGSFDELITPFLMDSQENLEFEEGHAPVANRSFVLSQVFPPTEGSQSGNFSFDGLPVDDLQGLFTASNDVFFPPKKAAEKTVPSTAPPAVKEKRRTRGNAEQRDDATTVVQEDDDDDDEQDDDDARSARRRKKTYAELLKQQVNKSEPRRSGRARNHTKVAEDSSEKPAPKRRSRAQQKPPKSQKSSSSAASSSELEEEEKTTTRKRARTAPPQKQQPSTQEEYRATALRFLQARTSNVLDRETWQELLHEQFEMSMPREPYRVAYGTPTARSTHTIRGLEGVVRDTRSMTALVEMIRARCKANARQEDIAADKLANVGLRYAVDETLVGARSLMCNWTFETVGLTHVGLSEELSVDGMLKASFADGRLERVALSFDCMAFMQQLNARGLLDMGAIAKAAAAASRGGLATSAAAAAPPPRPPVVVPAGLLGNATAVVSGHAGDLANRLPTTAQTDANQWIRNVVAAAAPAAAPTPAALQKQRNQQLLMQCMPVLANQFQTALLRQQQQQRAGVQSVQAPVAAPQPAPRRDEALLASSSLAQPRPSTPSQPVNPAAANALVAKLLANANASAPVMQMVAHMATVVRQQQQQKAASQPPPAPPPNSGGGGAA